MKYRIHTGSEGMSSFLESTSTTASDIAYTWRTSGVDSYSYAPTWSSLHYEEELIRSWKELSKFLKPGINLDKNTTIIQQPQLSLRRSKGRCEALPSPFFNQYRSILGMDSFSFLHKVPRTSLLVALPLSTGINNRMEEFYRDQSLLQISYQYSHQTHSLKY